MIAPDLDPQAAPPQVPATPPGAPAGRPALDHALRAAGVLVSVLAALLSGMLELLLSPLRVGGYLIGVVIPAAIVVNALISWFAVSTTARGWAIGPPWAAWTLLMVTAAGVRTAEGDYLISDRNWVALVLILAGSLTFAVCAYRQILRRPAVTKL